MESNQYIFRCLFSPIWPGAQKAHLIYGIRVLVQGKTSPIICLFIDSPPFVFFSLLGSSFNIILSPLLYSPRFFFYPHGFVLISLSVFLYVSKYFLHFIFQKIHLSTKHSLFQLISQIACLINHVANLQISFSRYLLYLSLFMNSY